MKKKVFPFALIFLFLAGLIAIGPAVAKPPEVINFASHTAGAGGYNLLALVAEGIIAKEKVKVRLVPAGSDVARTLMAYKGQADTSALTSISGWQIQEGLEEFSAPDWGPTPVRYLWEPQYVGAALVVRGDSSVKKIADLKGKKVATMPGSPAPQLINEAFLAFGGLSWKDVIKVPFPSPVAAYDGVIKQRIDSTFFNLVSSQGYELASMACGIRYLEMPASDKEGWKRLKVVCPSFSPRHATVGADISEKNPKWVGTMGYPNFLTWDRLDEDTAYYITKYIDEAYPIYSKSNKSLRLDWTIDKCLSVWDGDVVPFHKGAIRYFKEIGRWTPEREKMNEERIAHQAQLKKVWDETMKEAKQKGLTGKDFSKFWMAQRAKAGFWTPTE
jgi:TRAP transporter TAXI family solute receptor